MKSAAGYVELETCTRLVPKELKIAEMQDETDQVDLSCKIEVCIMCTHGKQFQKLIMRSRSLFQIALFGS